MPTVEEHQASIAQQRSMNAQSQERLRRLAALARASAATHTAAKSAELERNLAVVQSAALDEFSLEQLAWDRPDWPSWQPVVGELPASIALGSMREQRTGAELGVPHLAEKARQAASAAERLH